MGILKQKRFWTEVSIAETEAGFVVQLDGRRVKTPERADLMLPTHNAAALVAAEWEAQEGELDPTQMPATRWANVSIDRVGQHHSEVVDMLAAYGESDLMCYRAPQPQELVARQAEAWDPILEWAEQTLEAPLLVTQGVIPIEQPNQSVKNLHASVAAFDPFSLAAFHDLVQISGSLVLSMMVARGKIDPYAAWDLTQVDENWQKEQWGTDEEAEEATEKKRDAYLFAHKLFQSVASGVV